MRLSILHGIIGLVMIWHLSDASPRSRSVDEKAVPQDIGSRAGVNIPSIFAMRPNVPVVNDEEGVKEVQDDDKEDTDDGQQEEGTDESNETGQDEDEMEEETEKLVTIDAGYSLPSDGSGLIVYLFSGDQVQIIKARKAHTVMDRSELSIPKDMHLQAAFTPSVSNEDKDIIFYGDKNAIRVSQDGSHINKRIRYGAKRAFLRNGGPDAAASRAGLDYIFKGCQFIVRKSWKSWGKAEDLKSVGLPCNIDAAWSDGNGMVVLKGDQVWKWLVTGDLYGPWDFNGFYSLMDNWIMEPSVDATADKRGW